MIHQNGWVGSMFDLPDIWTQERADGQKKRKAVYIFFACGTLVHLYNINPASPVCRVATTGGTASR